MNSARKLPDAKPTWGSWLKPHTASLPPKPQEILYFAGHAPKEWDADKRRTYESMEASLLRDSRFRHLSVLPPDSLYVYHRVPTPSRVH